MFKSDGENRGFIRAYLDDIHLVGQASKVSKILSLISTHASRIGLQLNKHKSKVLLGADSNAQTPLDYRELQIIASPESTLSSQSVFGLTILGAPVGSTPFAELTLSRKLLALEDEIDSLAQLNHPQLQWTLLFWCIQPKLVHLQRTTCPAICQRLANNFDALLRRAMETILDTTLDNQMWRQLTMPITDGGFGLHSAQHVTEAAYAASSLQSIAAIESIFPNVRDRCQAEEPHNLWISRLQDAVRHLSSFHPSLLLSDVLLPNYSAQKKLQETLTAYVYQEVATTFQRSTSTLPAVDQARILSCAGQHAGAFLRAIPHPHSTLMTPCEFQTACYFRLGMNLPYLPNNLRCDCKRHPLVGNAGEHFHVCAKGNQRQEKHNDLVIAIQHLCTMAGIATRLEPKDCFPMHPKQLRPDLRLINPRLTRLSPGRQDIVVDVSVTHPGTDTNVRSFCSASRPGISAKRAEQRKEAYYDLTAAQHNLKFFPLVFESYGLLGPQLSFFLDVLLEAVYAKSDGYIPKSTLIDYWHKRLSVTIQRGNARMFINRSDRITKNMVPNFYPGALAEEILDNIPYTTSNLSNTAHARGASMTVVA
jgi:hypothetical protein